jgi:hypothetical protein
MSFLRHAYLKIFFAIQIHRVILESEYDPQLDVVFYRACKSSIERLCSKTLIHGGDHQTVSECIKAAYYSHHITDPACKSEVFLDVFWNLEIRKISNFEIVLWLYLKDKGSFTSWVREF